MIEKFDPSQQMPVSFTKAALQHFAEYLRKKGGVGVQISVKKTGCSGLAYVIEPVEKKPENHIEMMQSDVCFFVDKDALRYLEGLHVDYVKQALGLSQLVYSNPNEAARCGCGESFTVNEQDK
ncbi:HesB/IscA family protein [Facilibium subflavum]|uniref:HesB/IscA family protein n=1 Tax=Facilibium subflavum TaxID=2219058 RepID=UPI0013C362A6|nr:iron-sulfur cluster assembly accessory protein [Facilibium subflavum]